MNFLALSGLINLISSLALGSYVLVSNRRSPKNRTYFLFNLSIGVYSLGYFIWQLANDPAQALFWFKILFLGVILINLMYLQFVFTLLELTESKRNILIFSAVANAAFVGMNMGGLFYKGLEPRYGMGFWPIPTVFFHLYLTFWHWSCFYGFYWLIKGWQSSIGIRREQIKYVVIACGIGYFGGATNWPMWYGIKFPPYFNIMITAYVAIIAYSIVKYRLMDITLAFRYSLTNIFLTIVIGAPFAYAIWFFTHSPIGALLGFAATVVGHILLTKWKPKMTSNWVLAGKFALHKDENIKGHKDSIVNSQSLREWGDILCGSMQKLLGVNEAVVLVFDSSRHYFASVTGIGLEQLKWGIPIVIESESPLVKMLEHEKRIIIKEELQQIMGSEAFELIKHEMELLSAEVCLPFLMNERLVGILALGNKASKEMFNELDLKTMWKVGRSAEEQLRALLLGLLQQQFSSEWAHDLFHPFGSKGSFHYIQAALDGRFGELNPKFRKHLEDIVEEAEFVKNYMDTLLNPLKYMENGLYNIRPRVLTHYFEKAQRTYQDSALEQGIQWQVNAPPHTIKILGDAAILYHRVILNLIGNAFRYTPRGGTIELGYRLEEKILVIFVKDTGVGIPGNKIETVFDRGTQGNESNKGKAGLGLYNARQTVEAHHGRIWVESQLGKGTTFYFSLPLAESDENEISAA